MKRTTVKRVAALATTVALLVAVPGTAFAQTDPVETRTSDADRTEGLDQLKRRALTAIDTRPAAISRWVEIVDKSDHPTTAHRAALQTELSIDRAEETGFDVAEAQESLDRMSAHLAAAALLIDPVPRSVLALQAADMPEGGEQLRSAHVDLKSGGHELRATREAAREAVEALRDIISG